MEKLLSAMKTMVIGIQITWKHIQILSSLSSVKNCGSKTQISSLLVNAGVASCLNIDKLFLQGQVLFQDYLDCLLLSAELWVKDCITMVELNRKQSKILLPVSRRGMRTLASSFLKVPS